MPICADCNAEREVDEHGNCRKCGSKSIIHAMHPLVLLRSAQALIEATGELDTPLKRATLDFVAARAAQARQITLGQHLENTIEMWNLSMELSKEGKDPSEVPNSQLN